MSIRRPIRASKWYEGDPVRLARYIESTFKAAEEEIAAEKQQHPTKSQIVAEEALSSGGKQQHLLGLIGPHAGLSFCGTTSGCAYKRLREYLYRPTADGKVEGDNIRRIIFMGPSHAKYFKGVQFPASTTYGTPLGDLTVDTASQKEIEAICASNGVKTGWMSTLEDENEHCLELHTPFLAHILHNGAGPAPEKTEKKKKTLDAGIQIVPIIVGDMDTALESKFGACLRILINQPDTLFIISSDFCHWGERFRYTYKYDEDAAAGLLGAGGSCCPGDRIEHMDRAGMELISKNDTNGWEQYMRKTGNTICGRHAISSFMFAAQQPDVVGTSCVSTEFLHYSQSDRAKSVNDSSVSYASAVMTRK